MTIYDKYRANLQFELDATKGSLQDQSGNGTLTVASNPTWGLDKARFIHTDGTNDSLSYGNINQIGTDNFTIEFVVKSYEDNGTEYFYGRYQDGSNRFYVSKDANNRLLMYIVVGGSVVINCGAGVSTLLKKDGFVHIVFTGEQGVGTKVYINGVQNSTGTFVEGDIINTGDFKVGKYSTLCGEVGLKKARQWNTLFSPTEVAKLYEEYQSTPHYDLVNVKSYPASTGLADGNVKGYIADGKGWNESGASAISSGFIENTGWRIGAENSNSFKVKDEDGFNKSLEGQGAHAIAYRPGAQKYGTWEFELYKGDTGSQPYINFMSDRDGSTYNFLGFQYVVSTSETSYLRRATNGGSSIIANGSAGAFPLNQWVQVKITRDGAGNWEYFEDNVSIGTGTDDTDTSLVCSVLDLGENDRVKNFRFIPYIHT